MAPASKQIVDMVDMLPESDQKLAIELIKKLILAWDPDFTKLTPDEKKAIEEAEKEMAAGEYVRHEDVDWD